METNNREFARLKNILFISLIISGIVLFFVDNIYYGYTIFIILILFIFYYFYHLYKNLFIRIRNLIKYIDEDAKYIEDDDLGIIYDKVKKLKQENKKYQNDTFDEKMKIKKDMEDICHQMKTPLASLSLYNELLMERYRYDIVQKSSIQIDKMNDFINGLLKLSQVETIPFQFELLSIDYIVNLAIQSVYPLIESHKVEVYHNVIDIPFYCDESWLQESISNIFKNAVENGCHTLSISYENYSQYFKLMIHNDGNEISKKDLKHIFTRFYHTKESKGVGIGLALTQEIVQRHHGSINVYNQDGVVFEITLPLHSLSEKYDVTKM